MNGEHNVANMHYYNSTTKVEWGSVYASLGMSFEIMLRKTKQAQKSMDYNILSKQSIQKR